MSCFASAMKAGTSVASNKQEASQTFQAPRYYCIMPISYVLSKSSVVHRRIDWQSIKVRNVFWLPGSGEKLVFPMVFSKSPTTLKATKTSTSFPPSLNLRVLPFFPFSKKRLHKAILMEFPPVFFWGGMGRLRIRIRPLSQTNHIGSGSLTLVVSWNMKMAVHSEEDIPNLENHNENTGSFKVEHG